MKNTVAVVIGVVIIFAMLFGTISYSNYINRYKTPVPSAEEIFTKSCVERGGNPKTETGSDYTGDKQVRVNEFTCEGVSDVRN